jgi:hypothetical protein
LFERGEEGRGQGDSGSSPPRGALAPLIYTSPLQPIIDAVSCLGLWLERGYRGEVFTNKRIKKGSFNSPPCFFLDKNV